MNAFLDYAEKNTPAAVKARQRATENRRAKAAEKALAERDSLFSLWKLWKRERLDALLSGSHGAAVSELVAFLQTMTLEDATLNGGANLIKRVRINNWERADADIRFEILALVDAAIIAVRERAKLTPFDDPLGDSPDAFLTLRELLQ
jgi:hypothetical protein